MSAMTDMDDVIKQMRDAAKTIRDAAKLLGPALEAERFVRDQRNQIIEAAQAVRGAAGMLPDHRRDAYKLVSPSISWAQAATTAQREAAHSQSAAPAIGRLEEEILAFAASLDEAFEVGFQLASFGGAVVIHVRHLWYHQPNLIVFIGHNDDGHPVRLVQHLSQLSFLMVRVPRLAPDEPRQPIGFHASEGSTPDLANPTTRSEVQ